MRIHNLKAPQNGTAGPAAPAMAAVPRPAASPQALSAGDREPEYPADRQSLEIALLKAQIQHLELVVETARSLMGANQERLLRRLHEVPREMVELTVQLRRLDAGGVR